MVYTEIGLYYGTTVDLPELLQFSRFIGNYLSDKRLLSICGELTETGGIVDSDTKADITYYDLLDRLNGLISDNYRHAGRQIF